MENWDSGQEEKTLYKVYAAQRNSDTTEGRGPMVNLAYFLNEEEAIKAVQGAGVMGIGHGEVLEILVFTSKNEWEKYSEAYVNYWPKKIWGYRKNWQGRWDYGYIDNRDAPANDPEYKEYVRLKSKFEG